MFRRFKVSEHIASDSGEKFKVYEPSIMVGGSVKISDKFHKKQRESSGSLDRTFTVKVRR